MKQKSFGFNGSGAACYWSHPALGIGEFKVYGGNCGNPAHLDCDVYVALQSGSSVGLPFPWEPGFGKIVQVMYPVQDMHAPKNPEEFKQLVGWLCNQVQEGKKVHIGCIGGHGRTGLVLSAIVASMLPDEPDAIEYVRKNYCERAVESDAQVRFLVKHFKCKDSVGYKSSKSVGWSIGESSGPSYSGWSSGPSGGSTRSKGSASEFSPPKSSRFAGAVRTVDPVPSLRNIFAVAQ